mmetsp:Transcript_4737/g.7201  ORF Transcript_4737/g.7201 Transcript_4737/m.7201 type:complete len:97 (+) Transcript_4737:372-662(+)
MVKASVGIGLPIKKTSSNTCHDDIEHRSVGVSCWERRLQTSPKMKSASKSIGCRLYARTTFANILGGKRKLVGGKGATWWPVKQCEDSLAMYDRPN